MQAVNKREGNWNLRHNLIFALAIFSFLFAFTRMGIQGQNDLSHFMAAESLLNRHTRVIDNCPELYNVQTEDDEFKWSMCDIVKYDGHFYSSKPPVLNYMLAGTALILRQMGSPIAFQETVNQRYTSFILTLLIIGLTSTLGGMIFRGYISQYTDSELQATVLTVLTLFATIYLTYSVTLNHHTIAGTFILISFFLLEMHTAGKQLLLRKVLLAGFLMAMAVTIDCGPGFVFSIAFGTYLLVYVRSLKYLAFFALGSIPPLAFHCIVQYQTYGTILPVQFYSYMYEFEGGLLRGPQGFDIPRWKYWFLTLFSTRGLFTISPILLFGACGIIHEIKKGGKHIYPALAVSLGSAYVFFHHSFRSSTNFGGACYGFRSYIGFIPLLAFFAARYFTDLEDPKDRRIFYALGSISLLAALIGTRAPWTYMEHFNHPYVRFLLLFRGF